MKKSVKKEYMEHIEIDGKPYTSYQVCCAFNFQHNALMFGIALCNIDDGGGQIKNRKFVPELNN